MRIKKRSNAKFTLIASSSYQVKKYFKLNSCQKKLAKKYWPGPLSIVVNKKFAVRVPNNNIARKLARQSKTLLIATSFNKSGEPEIYDLKNKKHSQYFFYLDAGQLPKRQPSTIVECVGKKIIVHRRGGLGGEVGY